MKKQLLIAMVLLVMLIPLALYGLISNASGSHWLLIQILPLIPGQVSLNQSQGRLIDHMELTGITYQSDSADITLDTLILDWRPVQLFSGKLKIVELSFDGLKTQLKPSNKPPQESQFDVNADLLLPLPIQLDKLLVTNAEIKTGDSIQKIAKLFLSLATENDQLKLTTLELVAPNINAKAQGQVRLSKGFPLTVAAEWQLQAGTNGSWNGTTHLSGDLKQLNLINQLASPFKLSLTGKVNDVLATPNLTLNADWQALQWPVVGDKPQIKTEQGKLSLAGSSSDYKISLKTKLSQANLPKTDLVLTAHGNQNGLTIDNLELASLAGLLQIAGKTSWQNATEFDLTATGKHFNPAILLPQLPGNLSFATHIKGSLAQPLTIAAEINQLSGQLRGYPVNANGELWLNDQQLQIDSLKFNVGKNSIAANGKMDQQQAALDFNINAPKLAELWPDLSGNLQGEGHINGAWAKPNINIQIKGKQLGFAKNHLEQLAVNVAYYPDTSKTSNVLLTGNSLVSGSSQIKQLRLEGLGSLNQHSFTIDLKSNLGDLATRLTGNYKAKQWTGEISKLNLDRPDIGLWQIKKPSKLNVQQIAAGLQVSIAETCLVQASASLCSQGDYGANGDFKLAAKAASIPANLANAYLPKPIKFNTQLNADTHLQQKQGLLTGDYKLAMLPATLTLPAGEKTVDLELGASKLSGNINGSKVSADIDLQLIKHDFLRGQLQLDTGKSQALNGHLSAAIDEISYLQAFVPQLSELKAHLNANVGLQGTLSKPIINGQISLSQGNVELTEYGLGFRDISLHIESLADQSLQLQLSAAPNMLKGGPLNQQLKLQGLVNIYANLQQRAQGIRGDYQLNLPANSITLLQPTPKPLGAIQVSGHIDGDQQTAELHTILTGKDFVRGQTQFNTGSSKTLSGQLHASIDELGLLTSFLPQLANLKGHLGADLSVTGTMAEPIASGSINLSNAAVDVNDLGLKITDIKLQALAPTTQNGQIQLSGFAKSGTGTINIDGFIGLQKQPERTFNIHLNGTNFEIAKLPEAEIEISPDLKFASVEGKSTVTGIIKLPKAVLKIEQLPDNAIAVSKDEVIVDEAIEQPSKPIAPGIDANVEIDLGKQVSFSGQGLQTNLSGKLVVIQANAKLSMYGNVAMEKGRYKSYGQDLTIRKGRFVFNGSVENPWLEVEAIRLSKDKKVTAILGVSGSLSAPQTKVSSDPALPETEALAYLITGRALSQVSKSESNMLASAALSYGAGKASWLTSKLGIDEFDIEEGETLQDSLVSVGQYLTPEFYVGTKVGLFNKQASIILKYMLTEHINVETQTGTTKRVKLNYEYDRN